MSDPDRREDVCRELGADEARQAVSDACAAVAKRIAAAQSGSGSATQHLEGSTCDRLPITTTATD